ncbi:MAG: phosphatase PAP2 family protein [Mycobacteriales bacterium]
MRRDPTGQAVWVLRQLAVVLLGIVVYFGVRGLTAGRPSTAVAHAHAIVAFESHVGLHQEQRLQDLVVGNAVLTDAANWIYIWGHWPVIIVVMLWLGLRHRQGFLRLRNAMIASGAVGLVVYATYPVAPPRLTDLGLIDTVTERSKAYRVLQPPGFVNQYAAMPSLHVGWDLLVGLAVASAATVLWLRILGYLMPVLMALAVVFTANHYLIDGIAGAALALAGLGAALWWERRQARERTVVDLTAIEKATQVAPPSPRKPPERLSSVRQRSWAD